jgi:peptide/nickel transport system substrate-binding protein
MTKVWSVAALILLVWTVGPASAQPAPTGTLNIAIPLGGEPLDPTLNTDRNYVTPLFDHLIGIGDDGSLSTATGVAESWKLAADSKSLTIKVRRGIKFHNGDDLTSADVKFSLERMTGPKAINSWSNWVRNVIARIETPDPYTVVIHYKKPNAILPNVLSRQIGNDGAVMPMKYIKEKGEDYFASHPVGSGPYRFVEYKPGTSFTTEAISKHWRIGVPKYKTLVYYQVKEESTRIAMLKTGAADVVQIGRDQAQTVGPPFKIYEKPGSDRIGLYIDHAWVSTSYLASEKVREALSISVNREELKNFVFGGFATVAGGPNCYGSYALGYEEYKVPFDPKRAAQLVQEAFPKDKPKINLYTFTERFPEAARMAEAVAGYWEKVGISTKIIPIQYATYRTEASKDEPNLLNSVGLMDLGNRLVWDGCFDIILHSKGLLGKNMIRDAKLDALVETLRAESDPNKVAERQRAVTRYIFQHNIQVSYLEIGSLYAVNPTKITKWPRLARPIAYDISVDDLLRRE